jgi:hypothetical protein
MKLKQFLLVFFLITLGEISLAELLFKPYLGLGQSTIVLGSGNLVNGNIRGYLLGLRLGLPLTNSIYIAADYSRGGPYEYSIIDRYQNANYPKTIFNIFSGGAGIGINGSTLTFWYGVYPYHIINEYNLDFRMKGEMRRLGMGLRVGRDLELHFFSDSSVVVGDNLSNSARNIVCTYSMSCDEVGKYESITFAIGARF